MLFILHIDYINNTSETILYNQNWSAGKRTYCFQLTEQENRNYNQSFPKSKVNNKIRMKLYKDVYILFKGSKILSRLRIQKTLTINSTGVQCASLQRV